MPFGNVITRSSETLVESATLALQNSDVLVRTPLGLNVAGAAGCGGCYACTSGATVAMPQRQCLRGCVHTHCALPRHSGRGPLFSLPVGGRTCSADLITTQHPAASAGASFQMAICRGGGGGVSASASSER